MIRHTVLALAIAAMPAAMAAQGGGQQGQQQDTTGQQGNRTVRSSGGTTARNAAGARSRGNNYGLDREQIRQLQQAINDLPNCDVGEADGRIGPRTRRGIACARRETGVTGNDMQALFEALNLDFQTDENGQNAAGSGGERGNRANASSRDSTRTRNQNARPNRPGGQRDSTQRDSTQRDTTQGPA
jgi:hypothetical protein